MLSIPPFVVQSQWKMGGAPQDAAWTAAFANKMLAPGKEKRYKL
jgi:hypothetical protein